MDERLRDLERRAAAGDPAAREELERARRRLGPSEAAALVLEAHRRLIGREHDPERPAELSLEQAVELIEALYRAQGWEPAPRKKDALLSPDGQRRLVWGKHTPRRERRRPDVFVDDVRRQVVALGSPLTEAQRTKARELLGG